MVGRRTVHRAVAPSWPEVGFLPVVGLNSTKGRVVFELHAKSSPAVTVEHLKYAGPGVELSVHREYVSLTLDEAKQVAKALKDAANRTVVAE